MFSSTLRRRLATLATFAVTAGLLFAAAGPASASQTAPPITPADTQSFGDTPNLSGGDMLLAAGPASASQTAPAHTEAATAPAYFQLVIDGVDCGWSSPALSDIPPNKGLPVTVPKLDGSSKEA